MAFYIFLQTIERDFEMYLHEALGVSSRKTQTGSLLMSRLLNLADLENIKIQKINVTKLNYSSNEKK